jgi:hypothetical protein
MPEFSHAQAQDEVAQTQASDTQNVDEVLDLWVEELPDQTNFSAAPIGTSTAGSVSTAACAGSSVSSIGCASTLACLNS